MRFRVAALLLLFLFAAEASAQEHVLFEVQGRDKILGTIRPANETETILCRMERGTTLKAVAKSKDKAGPVPTLQVLLGDLPVAGVEVVPKGRGSAIVPYVVQQSGTYKVVVAGDGDLDGDYQAAVSWTPQKKFAGAGTSAGETAFAFSAPAHAAVTVKLSAAKGSGFLPHLVSLDGPSGVKVALSGGGAASKVALPVRGDWSVRFVSDGAEGAYVVSVTVSAPRPAKHTVDIRDGALAGPFSGGPTVQGAVIDPEDGGSVSVTDPGSPIAGSSVAVPPDSLGQTTSIYVAEAAPYTPPGGDVPVGPAVEFGPSGTQFDASAPAVVTIPFDENSFPGGTGALVIYVKSADGTIEPVLPTSSYIFGSGVVTFSTSHFSTFRAATTDARGPPVGGYTYFDTIGGPTFEFGGTAAVSEGTVFFDKGTFQIFADRQSLHFESGLAQGSQPPTLSLDESFEDGAGDVTARDDSTIVLTGSFTGPALGNVRRGADDDLLLVEHADGTQLGAAFLVRPAATIGTLNSLAGRWNVLVWEVEGTPLVPGETTLPLFVTAEAGTADVDAAGPVTFKLAGGVKRFTDYPGGNWNTEPLGKRQASGNLSIDVETGPVLDFGDRNSFLQFTLGARGDLMVGRMVNFDRGTGLAKFQLGLMILVRESARAKATDLAGSFIDVLGALDVGSPGSPEPPDPLNLVWRAHSGTDTFAGTGFQSSFRRCLSGFEATGGEPFSKSDDVPAGAARPFTLSKTGAFASPAGEIQGAAAPGGRFLVYLVHDPLTQGLGLKIRLPGE